MTLDIPEGALSKLGIISWLHFRVRIKTQVPVYVLRELRVTVKAPEDKIFTVEKGGRWLSEEESHGLDVILRMEAAWGAGTSALGI